MSGFVIGEQINYLPKQKAETINSPMSQGGHIAPGEQKSFVLPR